MAETFITQCPHCGTSFRVKDDQLAVANGSVRCGACLQVFSARNHIVSGKSTASGAGVKKPATTQQREPQKSAAKTPASQKQTAHQATHPLAEQANSQPSDSEFEIDQDDDADFIFADDPDEDDEYIFQDSDDDHEDRQDGELGEFSDSFLSLSAPEPDKRQLDPFQRETQSLNREMFEDADSPDESWAESILDELEREERQKPEAKPEARKRKPNAPRSESETLPHFRAADPTPAPTAVKEATEGNRASQLVRQLNHEIDLDFDVEERLARWRWLGGIFALLLLVLLAGQLAWLQKDTYAKMDQWKGLYATACDVLGCSLPAQEDLDKIRASNVLVRDHKAVEGVKMLDAVLINRAPFKQAFPILILQYTDVNGELVADQAFKPEQYLRGELTGARQMPTNTRVYVSIPIRDPGERAVNYQLQLAPS